MSVGLVSSWPADGHLLPGLSHGLPSVWVCVLISSYKDTSHNGFGPTHMTSNFFNLNYLFKDPVSKYSHILRYWGLGLRHMTLGRTQFSL